MVESRCLHCQHVVQSLLLFSFWTIILSPSVFSAEGLAPPAIYRSQARQPANANAEFKLFVEKCNGQEKPNNNNDVDDELKVSRPPLKEKIAQIRKACTPLLGKKIMYYESLWWREPPDNMAEERDVFFLGFSNPTTGVLMIHWVDYDTACIQLWTKQEVDAYFAKELPEGNIRRDYDQYYYAMWRETVTKNGCGLDIIGATIQGVYLADNESYPDTWTDIFFDLGNTGWLTVHTGMDVNGYEFFNELCQEKPKEQLIRCL